MRYSSSEEGEVEEIPSDHYVLDDEKHRAKHEDLNRERSGMFSSESEIYNDNNNHDLLSLKNEGNKKKTTLICFHINMFFVIRDFF